MRRRAIPAKHTACQHGSFLRLGYAQLLICIFDGFMIIYLVSRPVPVGGIIAFDSTDNIYYIAGAGLDGKAQLGEREGTARYGLVLFCFLLNAIQIVLIRRFFFIVIMPPEIMLWVICPILSCHIWIGGVRIIPQNKALFPYGEALYNSISLIDLHVFLLFSG